MKSNFIGHVAGSVRSLITGFFDLAPKPGKRPIGTRRALKTRSTRGGPCKAATCRAARREEAKRHYRANRTNERRSLRHASSTQRTRARSWSVADFMQGA